MKVITKKTFLALLSVGLVLALVTNAWAKIIYNASYTGAELDALVTSGDASYPSGRTVTVTGSRLDFLSTGAEGGDMLYRLPIASEGDIPYDQLSVSLTLDVEKLHEFPEDPTKNNDFDVVAGIYVGSTRLWFTLGDIGNDYVVFCSINTGLDGYSVSVEMGNHTDQSFPQTLQINIDATGVGFTFPDGPFKYRDDNVEIDLSNQIDVVLYGNDPYEEYGYKSIDINAISQSESSVSIYFPHIASNSTWETEVCIINTSSQHNLSGFLQAYSDSGQPVDSKSVSLASKARREIIVGNEFSNPSDIGYIIFESDSENICGYTKFYTEGKYRVVVPAVSNINAGDIYMSHIASNTNWWTGISILNTTSSSKELTVEFDNGTTKPITIAAQEHQAFTINSLFGGELQPNINSAVIKNGSGIVGLELFGSSDSSGDNYLSGILLKDDTTTQIYYPHIASNSTWWTGIVAYNPSATSCNLTITPFSENGISLTPQTLALAGHEKYIGVVRDLNFPEGTAWFRIIASSPITGFELFGTNDGNQLGGYTGVGISGTNGVFAKTEKEGWTGIAFVNIENSPATVTMTAYDDSGNVIDTETLNITAYKKVVDVAPNLFSQDISNATYISYSSDGEVVGFQLNGSSDDMMLDALPGM